MENMEGLNKMPAKRTPCICRCYWVTEILAFFLVKLRAWEWSFSKCRLFQLRKLNAVSFYKLWGRNQDIQQCVEYQESKGNVTGKLFAWLYAVDYRFWYLPCLLWQSPSLVTCCVDLDLRCFYFLCHFMLVQKSLKVMPSSGPDKITTCLRACICEQILCILCFMLYSCRSWY